MKAIKSLLKHLFIHFFGIEIKGLFSRWLYYNKLYPSGRFASFNIDRKLEALLPHRNGFYVEIGANDGAYASNSYFFELKKNWKGVLVEPAPNLYLSCVKRRFKNNHIFCNACTSFDYKSEFVRMIYSDLMTISDNIELDIGDHKQFINSGQQFLMQGESSFYFGAKAATLNSLLLQADAPNLIDFLSLDVEGAELEVLKGIDFSVFRFKYMVIECRDIQRLEPFLKDNGYVIVKNLSPKDYLFTSTKDFINDYEIR